MSNYQGRGLDELAAMFKALSNPSRLRLFLRLSTSCCGPSCCAEGDRPMHACVGDLARELGLAASTVSHHLKELRQVGLLRIERRGQRIECAICDGPLRALASFLGAARTGQVTP